jgi:hypothetical protein
MRSAYRLLKATLVLAVAPLFGLTVNGLSRAAELSELKVLYVGSERSSDYVSFLKGKVAVIEEKTREAFNPGDEARFDVVLFDWPQSEATREMRRLKSPLGTREAWNKPTVLLGSAGLNLAVCWKLKGGSGCTCLDPLAYDLRDHEIFDRPFKIDRGKMISIPTPADFADELKETEIKVLPLVADIHQKRGMPGWCTHALDFARLPDVEFFCGGVNSQTPTSAGLWRQGNLLHFGFEQSPSEMNESGQRLLLNAIAYISRFSEDRPIEVTPSPFVSPVGRSRVTVIRWLTIPSYRIDFVKEILAPEVWEDLAKLPDRESMAKRAEEISRFLHPNREQRLAIDEDLAAWNIAFDQPEFFDKAIAGLRSDDPAAKARAARLLGRYVPDGAGGDSADAWGAWWKENKPYAFASDGGDYRWYIDPLAKKRGVPASEMRGPRRADRP